jgi:DNA modification methylase
MTKYTCERCLKDFSQKSHYSKHQNKKTPCQDNKGRIEEVVENIIINKKLIYNFNENNIINRVEMSQSQEVLYNITNNVSLYISDANNITYKLNNIDFIYMDPPYDTNRNFTLDSKSDKTGFCDKWTSNNYELWLSTLVSNLKKTLSNKGTLVIHISSENSFTIEKILRDNFKNIEKIYWKRCHGKNTVKNKFGAVIDILFVAYDEKRIFNQESISIDENSVWAFKNKDDVGSYSMGALKHDRTRKGHVYTIEHNEIKYETEYGWKLSKDVVEKMISENRVHFVPKSKNMYIKVYKHEHKGKPLSNLWDDIHSITRTSKDPRLYPTQKPQKLLERLIKIFTNPESTILDPVCGSGTTGFVADKLNRKCILIDVNEEVLPIITKRFEDKIYNI